MYIFTLRSRGREGLNVNTKLICRSRSLGPMFYNGHRHRNWPNNVRDVSCVIVIAIFSLSRVLFTKNIYYIWDTYIIRYNKLMILSYYWNGKMLEYFVIFLCVFLFLINSVFSTISLSNGMVYIRGCQSVELGRITSRPSVYWYDIIK